MGKNRKLKNKMQSVKRTILVCARIVLFRYSTDAPVSNIFIILSYKYPLEKDTHVSLLIGMEFSAVDITGRMGHESIDITLHYAHMFPSAQKDMANKLNMERIW